MVFRRATTLVQCPRVRCSRHDFEHSDETEATKIDMRYFSFSAAKYMTHPTTPLAHSQPESIPDDAIHGTCAPDDNGDFPSPR